MKMNWRRLVSAAIFSLLGLFATERGAFAQALNWSIEDPNSTVLVFGSFTFPSGNSGGDFQISNLLGVGVTSTFLTDVGLPNSVNPIATQIGLVTTPAAGTPPNDKTNCAVAATCAGSFLGTVPPQSPPKFGINSMWFGFTLDNGGTPVSFAVLGNCTGGSTTCALYDIYSATANDTNTITTYTLGGLLINNSKAACTATGTQTDFCASEPAIVPEIDASNLPKAVLMVGALLLLLRRERRKSAEAAATL